MAVPSIKAEIRGWIQGKIWMPPVTCTKHFHISEVDFRYADGKKPTLRDMVLKATNDGDFQSAELSEGELILTMVLPRADKKGSITKTKTFNLRWFPSVSDCVCPEDLIVYPEVA